MFSRVLVLNADYRALTLCSVERAFLLLFLNKADLVHHDKKLNLRSVNETYPYPSVIRLSRYVHVPYKGVMLTRQNIYKRDNYTCQYCGQKNDLTLDHVVPKSKGGKSSWTNLVAACMTCNSKKGHKSPGEAGMVLRKSPSRPTFVSFLKDFSGGVREDWHPYLQVK